MPLKLERVDSRTIGTFRNLMQLFLHEMSSYRPDEVNEDGLFNHDHLGKEPDSKTDLLLIRVKGQLAGFAVVSHMEGDIRLLSSFFILNAYRGLGLGRESAQMVFNTYHGRWIVLAMETSTPAKTFWRRVIRAYTHRQYGADPDTHPGALSFHFATDPNCSSSEAGSSAFSS